MSTWKVILATLVIFCAGLFTGGLGVKSLLQQRTGREPLIAPQGMRTEFLRRMARELELQPEQRERIDQILAESQERHREIMGLVGPELRDEYRRTVKLLRDELSPEQRRNFDQLLEQRGRRPGLGSSVRPSR